VAAAGDRHVRAENGHTTTLPSASGQRHRRPHEEQDGHSCPSLRADIFARHLGRAYPSCRTGILARRRPEGLVGRPIAQVGQECPTYTVGQHVVKSGPYSAFAEKVTRFLFLRPMIKLSEEGARFAAGGGGKCSSISGWSYRHWR
jgi:hypothetical protein